MIYLRNDKINYLIKLGLLMIKTISKYNISVIIDDKEKDILKTQFLKLF